MLTPPTARLTVHPRAGGEHVITSPARKGSGGSSPRGRGTRAGPLVEAVMGRFIPARAGNTPRRRSSRSHPAVHPRAGGEHPLPGSVEPSAAGSSPRGRGTHPALAGEHDAFRFIPARAGNTSDFGRSFALAAVHPRAGGEHCTACPGSGTSPGSSPRGRGTQQPLDRIGVLHRFIPARAGNTTARARTCAAAPVHPRAGGEHCAPLACVGFGRGSSPRGRGTHQRGARRRGRARFIPARAGNTSPPPARWPA